MGFNDTLQQIVNMDTEEKIHLAADSFFTLQPVFEAVDPEYKGMTIVYALLGTVLVADEQLSPEELGFAKGMLSAIGEERSDDEIVSLCEYTAKTYGQAYEIIRSFREKLTDDGVTELITFVAALCSIDDRISADEVKLIKSLF